MSTIESPVPNYKVCSAVEAWMYRIDGLLLVVVLGSNVIFTEWWQSFLGELYWTEDRSLFSDICLMILFAWPIILHIAYYYLVSLRNIARCYTLVERKAKKDSDKNETFFSTIAVDKDTAGDFGIMVLARAIMFLIVLKFIFSEAVGVLAKEFPTAGIILFLVLSVLVIGYTTALFMRAKNSQKNETYQKVGGK